MTGLRLSSSTNFTAASVLAELDQRSRDVFRQIVETYLDTGEPVGSRTVSQAPQISLSAASVRNVMADLEDLGLLVSPHTSAGRLPTEIGLRLFVDGLLQVGDLSQEEQRSIESQIAGSHQSLEELLTQASTMLSGLSRCAGVVVTPKKELPLRHVEFVNVGPGKALVVLVTDDGSVENRLVDVPAGLPASALTEATNYLSARLAGRTLSELGQIVAEEMEKVRAELSELTAKVVEDGLASWTGEGNEEDTLAKSLIVRGRSNLLENLNALEDLERVRLLFDELESKKDLVHLLKLAEEGEGVRIFIGSQNKLFSLSGSSLVISPYMNADKKVVGVLGVIGPTRLNYAKIIPMVDYTAKVVGRLIS